VVKYKLRIGPSPERVPDLRVTRRFLAAYGRTAVGFQGRVEGEIHDLVRRFRADPRLGFRGYDQLAHLRPNVVLELEVSGADRLLAIANGGTVILADLGGHEVTERYTTGKYRADVFSNEPAPSRFWPDSGSPRLFADRTDEPLSIYHTETSADWIYWLSDQQYEAVRTILEAWDRRGRHKPLVHFVVGGPGTGKTSVLLTLLKDLTELGHQVRIVVSDRLAAYINASLRTPEFDRHRGQVDTNAAEVLLIDDPGSLGQVSWPLRGLSPTSRTRLLVMAFDPCQLLDSLSDNRYARLIEKHVISEHVLTECYRQKRVVGRAAQATFHSIAMSSAYYRPDKIDKFRQDHERLTSLSNNARFVNRGGYSKSYLPRAKIEDVRYEVNRICSRYPRWTHWPSTVVIVDSEAHMPRLWLNELEPVQAEVVDETAIQDIKGLEYQHAFLFLGPNLQRRISEVINGQGQKGYFDTRLLRIPISRAKDSVVVFGLN